uniref:Fatty acyl-CoA reductase n=2 Tax=Lygus hesperus TaxID=30085 RepID=A0A0A9XVU3_LYGHE
MNPSVVEWLEGKDILITGATGFMGKCLVEKLLRCCPGVNRLYLIVRTKRGTDAQDRMKDYSKNALFGTLLEQNPNAFDKVIAVPGDMSALECGLSKENQQILKENISIVFHTAASVRFDDSLSDALKLNTRGTYELIKIAKGMKKLEVFQYVSTTYCNANVEGTIEEKVYPSHLDWRILLRLLEKDEAILDLLVNKLISTQPNTYTLTKSLAENVVLEVGNDIPAIIIRPSVVIPIMTEPLPGWSDNLNGVVGVTVGVSKGVLRTFKCAPHAVLDYVPVDVAINGMIGAAWAKRFHNDGQLSVLNQTYGDRIPVTFDDIVKYGVEVNQTYPMENYMWYPFMVLTNNTYYYHLLFFFLQLIPALFIDLLLKLLGHKTMLLRLNIKIYNAAMALSDFSEKPFKFDNSNYQSVSTKMHASDRKIFPISEKDYGEEIVVLEFMKMFQKGLKKYVFHEKEENQEKYLRMHNRLYYIDRATRMALLGFLFWKLAMWGSFLLNKYS